MSGGDEVRGASAEAHAAEAAAGGAPEALGNLVALRDGVVEDARPGHVGAVEQAVGHVRQEGADEVAANKEHRHEGVEEQGALIDDLFLAEESVAYPQHEPQAHRREAHDGLAAYHIGRAHQQDVGEDT